MPVVMKSFGTAQGDQRYAGWYLKEFDHEAHDGRGEIVMTFDVQEAKVFPDLTHAFEFRQRSPRCKPWREDGQPNRPLTASHWQFMTVEFEGGKVKADA